MFRRRATPTIPAHVRDFLGEHIHAVEQLEVLLLLHADRAEAWTARSVSRAMHVEEALAADALDHLCVQGLLVTSAGPTRHFKYAPVDAALDARVQATAETYGNARLEVLTSISRGAMDRIHSAHDRAFASSFLLRKKPGRS